MPMLVEHIDAIARQKQRDVLYITFHPTDYFKNWGDYDYHTDPKREKVIAWLEKNGIGWVECGPVENECSCFGYLGQIYVDVPFDEYNPQYQLVRDYLENPDGTMRNEEVRFYYLPLEHAMKNAHHDEQVLWNR